MIGTSPAMTANVDGNSLTLRLFRLEFLNRAAGVAPGGESAGNPAVALDLAGIADIDDHDVVALRSLDGVGGTQRFDLGIGLVDQRLDAAMDGLWHELTFGSITLRQGRPAPSPVGRGLG